MNNPRVAIFVAAYNGARYLHALVDSLLNQTGVEVTIYINDDKSSDQTPTVCMSLAEEHKNITYTQNQQNLGVSQNFMTLVQRTSIGSYDYYAFADQDDIWLPKKLIVAIRALKLNNANFYYSRVSNYDATCTTFLYNSAHAELRNESKEMATISPGVLGCTIVFDNFILGLLHRYKPKTYPMFHDSWTYAVSRFLGKVYFDGTEPLIKRRLTGSNVEGLDQRSARSRFANHIRTLQKGIERPNSTVAEYLLEGYSDLLSITDKKLLQTIAYYRDTPLTYVRLIFDHKIRKERIISDMFLRTRMLLTWF